MHKRWPHYFSNLIAGFVTLIIVGLILGQLAWVLVLGLASYLTWTLIHAIRLHRWLYNPQPNQNETLADKPPPLASGLWGDLFDGIYRLQRTHNDAQDKQQQLINRIQESTNALKDCVIMTDNKGRMEWWNLSTSRLLGFRPATDRGQHIFNLLRLPDFKHYFDSKDYTKPLELPSPLYPHVQLSLHITLFGEDERLIIAQDITRIYQLELMRKDFVSNVSHEMRTPLTVISGYLETIGDNIETLPSKWHRAIRTMSQQSSRMEALITDLLLLAKVETSEKRTTHADIDIQHLLNSITQDAIALSGDKQQLIKTSFVGNTHLEGDEQQLRSAFSNLVFNAVKYTPPKSQIMLRWWTDNCGAHFSVKDNGTGFDPMHIPRLTERFYRVDPSRNSTEGGTGLGLAIVKHVLRNHDAELEIKSIPGTGSEFTCHFPGFRSLAANENDP